MFTMPAIDMMATGRNIKRLREMAGLTVKPDREEYVTFSTSYYNASQRLVVKADNTDFDACTDAASVEAILKKFFECSVCVIFN